MNDGYNRRSDSHEMFSIVLQKVAKIERLSNGTANIDYQCQLELITCSACVFKLNIM